ncbi:MAG: M16 family metallopeptidase [Caulobacterales bacterium]
MIRLPRATLAALAALTLATSAAALGHPKLDHPPVLGHGAAQAAPAPKLKPGEWAQSQSDLRADPNVRFGALANGMRYAILKNATPPGQASLRLRFDAGSMMERDDQQGLAHFLEHMAFGGSKAVPDRGEMIKILQRLGLAFGADTNAGTSFDATTYKLDLPKSDDETIDTAMMLLREAAGNLTLKQEAMDQERGVILSEERLRDTPAYRITKSRYEFLMAGQLPPKRFPIGLVPVIQTAKRDLIADFYNAYYRPGRAVLIAVGDFDPDVMEAKIKARFSDWRNDAPAGADPDIGPVGKRGAQFRIAVEDGAPTNLELAWVTPPDLSADTIAKRRREWIDRLGLQVLNRRMATLARDQNPPFISAGAFRGAQLRTDEITGVIVNTQPDKWAEGLAAAEAEQRRLVQYGVRPDELAREITEQEASLKLAAAGAATRRTPVIADEIAGTLEDDEVETSPADDLTLFETVTKDLKPETVSAAMKADFEGSGPLVFMSARAPVDGGEKALRTAFETDRAKPVSAPEAPRQAVWPYTDFGTPTKIAEQKEVSDLDTVFVRFENGVRLTVKSTKFRTDQVLVRVRFGDGLEGLAPDRQAMTWAGSAFTEGGLKQISADDTERALAGQVYGLNFGAEDDAFSLVGETRTSDVTTQLQVMAAYVSDPGWQPEAFQRMKGFGKTLQDQYDATDTGVFGRDLAGLMHAGDRRWTFPTRDQIEGETLDDLKGQVTPSLASGPIEVIVVGDITVDKAIAAVDETFGALAKRPDPAAPAPPAHPPGFPAPNTQPVVETHKGRADQAMGFETWPTDDFFANPQQARINDVLSDVIQLRLIDVLRLREGVTYAPGARASASFVWPHWGFISAQIEAPPAKIDGFFADVAKIVADLRTTPATPDELERAKKPRIEGLEKAMATNEYWLFGLSDAQADPRRLDNLRAAEAGLERVTAADLMKAAQTYLLDEKAWKLVVKPQGS